MLRISRPMFSETVDTLRKCGESRRECIVYWLGSRSHGGEVVAVVHPDHISSSAHYDVDSPWVTQLWLRLHEMDAEVVGQVHTHPTGAFHSRRDDDFAILHTPGFLSLVLPRFAQNPDPLSGAYLARIDDRGTWEESVVDDQMEIA